MARNSQSAFLNPTASGGSIPRWPANVSNGRFSTEWHSREVAERAVAAYDKIGVVVVREDNSTFPCGEPSRQSRAVPPISHYDILRSDESTWCVYKPRRHQVL